MVLRVTGLWTLSLNLCRWVWVHGGGRRLMAYRRKSSEGISGLDTPVRVEASLMALGRLNMYFSSFMGRMVPMGEDILGYLFVGG
jgi:hypothetical protein